MCRNDYYTICLYDFACQKLRKPVASSVQSFGDFWKDALSVLMARERARIGLAASKGDWPRRIAAYARDEQEDAAAYADS